MIAVTIPDGIRAIASGYKDLIDGQYSSLAALLMVHFTGNGTLSDTVRACGWAPSVSTLSRAVQMFDPERFMKRHRGQILKKLSSQLTQTPDRFIFALDDTPIKKSGKKIHRARHWRSHRLNPYYGQRVLVLSLVDLEEKIAIPLSYCILCKRSEPDYESGWAAGIRLIEEVLAEGFPRLSLVADCWFGVNAFMDACKRLGLKYIVEIKQNRRARATLHPTGKWNKFKGLFCNCIRGSVRWPRESGRKALYCQERLLQLKGLSGYSRIMAVYKRAHASRPEWIYATNDFECDAFMVLERARGRWCVEVMHRDLKQTLAWGRLPCLGAAGAGLSVCLPLILLASLRLSPDIWGAKLPHPRPVGAYAKQIREESLQQAITTFVLSPTDWRVAKLRARRHPWNLTHKPTDSPLRNPFPEKYTSIYMRYYA